ncbi:uncharacterized protein N7529_011155 [Penicillium soppii]|uniref:uncharacterized protein n=1 Tax=Penicillium soppii TaxID=69789 RepID=UPI0025491008|nr:uncharacterized protein N7529_011155 [Penicillium soppii]KAJ5851770.1 hypothetical protein N7529_011155 [Penicillium soppii]
MSSHHRHLSPNRGRHHTIDPMRASTGTVQLGSSYDHHDPPSYHDSSRRYEYDDYISDTGYASAYGYGSARPPILEAHPVSSHRVHDPTSSAKKRTEYTVKPRHRSNTASAADFYSTPVRLEVPSKSRHHLAPVKHTTHRPAPGSFPSESAPHVVEAAPRYRSHHRLPNTDYASDVGYRDSRDDMRHRASPSSPRTYPPSQPRRHPAYDGLRKGDDIDDFDAYSYTTPREQFDRDYPVKPRTRGSRYADNRPLSISGIDSSQWAGRKERHHGPPPTSWGLDKMARERPRGSSRSRDDHHDVRRSKEGVHDQALVAVPHDSDDEDYRHGRTHRRHHRRHEDDRDRHYGGDYHPKSHDSGSLPVVGLGTAALGGRYSDVSDYEQPRSPKGAHRRTHDEHDKRGHDAAPASSRELAIADAIERNRPGYLAPEDAHRHGRRRHSRRRRHSDEAGVSEDDLERYRQEPSAPDSGRRRHSSTDTSESDRDRSRERSRHRRHRDHSRGHRSSRSRHRMLEDGNASEPRRSPPDMTKDDSKKLVAVEPPIAPKEPGGAPQGNSQGSPSGFPGRAQPRARWTKIDRRLVNPEALEAGNERFEERSDYVIVLRVLTKEEIQLYAVKTQEIRDTRHKEQVRERRKSRDETQRHGRRGEGSSSDDEYEGEDKPRKQLEAPPTSEEWRPSLPARPRASTNSMQEAERPRMGPSATPA